MKKTYHFAIELNIEPLAPEPEGMPDCAGLWVDCDEDVWLVDNALNATAIRVAGDWMNTAVTVNWDGPDKYAKYAPFTRVIDVTTSKEEA